MWQELSGVGILQRLGSEPASSRLDLAPSETSLGPEVAFFRPKVSSLLAIASMAESHTFSVKDVGRGPLFARLAAHVLGLACAPVVLDHFLYSLS
jgi:hypothetical protein